MWDDEDDLVKELKNPVQKQPNAKPAPKKAKGMFESESSGEDYDAKQKK